ncbi:MAG: hypothetical protein JKY65_07615, partial [Planctomycetes bacterium]|nr:hypothetical protein [Planctomycetota bacterium]
MGMLEGYKAAASISRKQIASERPADLDHLAKTQIVVVAGCYDRGQDVFALCDLASMVIQPDQVAAVGLDPDQILFVNCPGQIPERGLEKIKSFVESGGMLVTTDWALKHVVEAAFPGYLEYNQRATADDVVRVVFGPVQDAFLEGLLDPNDDPLWWLEGSSYPIRILRPDDVQVLVSSQEMQSKYGEAPIVVTFEVGLGKIYHLTSHFYLQRTDTRSKRHTQNAAAYAAE